MSYHFPKYVESSGLDFISLVRKRRSIRAFRADPVDDQKIETILAAGHKAPSGANRHPWKFCVVRDAAQKQVVRDRCEDVDRKWHDEAEVRIQKWLDAKHITPEKSYLTDAPVLIIVFGDTEDPYWRESVWVSVGFMLLAAVDQGLGSLVYTPGNPEFLNETLNISERYSPQAILPIGFPAVEPQISAARQTELEHQAAQGIDNQKFINDIEDTDDFFDVRKSLTESQSKEKKCACGCGKLIVGLNTKRKYIHGHAKFGPGGLLKVLRNPPRCKCGCGEPTEWDWEKMNWKKFRDRHIGVRKKPERRKSMLREQYDLFK